MAVDPELRDDLYEELVEEVRQYVHWQSDLDDVVELAEKHADRRTARALRIVADDLENRWVAGVPLRGWLNEVADRFDPDVETEEQ